MHSGTQISDVAAATRSRPPMNARFLLPFCIQISFFSCPFKPMDRKGAGDLLEFILEIVNVTRLKLIFRSIFLPDCGWRHKSAHPIVDLAELL
jgi:hypothetical protein